MDVVGGYILDKKVLFIINPVAGTKNIRKRLLEILELFTGEQPLFIEENNLNVECISKKGNFDENMEIEHHGDNLKIGIKWQGNTYYDKDRVISA